MLESCVERFRFDLEGKGEKLEEGDFFLVGIDGKGCGLFPWDGRSQWMPRGGDVCESGDLSVVSVKFLKGSCFAFHGLFFSPLMRGA